LRYVENSLHFNLADFYYQNSYHITVYILQRILLNCADKLNRMLQKKHTHSNFHQFSDENIHKIKHWHTIKAAYCENLLARPATLLQ